MAGSNVLPFPGEEQFQPEFDFLDLNKLYSADASKLRNAASERIDQALTVVELMSIAQRFTNVSSPRMRVNLLVSGQIVHALLADASEAVAAIPIPLPPAG